MVTYASEKSVTARDGDVCLGEECYCTWWWRVPRRRVLLHVMVTCASEKCVTARDGDVCLREVYYCTWWWRVPQRSVLLLVMVTCASEKCVTARDGDVCLREVCYCSWWWRVPQRSVTARDGDVFLREVLLHVMVTCASGDVCLREVCYCTWWWHVPQGSVTARDGDMCLREVCYCTRCWCTIYVWMNWKLQLGIVYEYFLFPALGMFVQGSANGWVNECIRDKHIPAFARNFARSVVRPPLFQPSNNPTFAMTYCCGNLPQEWYSEHVRCFATACWFHSVVRF
jgi:hypothetical protein